MDPSNLSVALLRQRLRSKLGDDAKLPRKKEELVELYKRENPTSGESNADSSMTSGNHRLRLGLGHNPKYTPGEGMDPSKLSGNVLLSKLRSKLGEDAVSQLSGVTMAEVRAMAPIVGV